MPAWLGPVRQPPRKQTVAQAEVAPVLLHEQVGGRLGDAEQRVGAVVDRHRRVDPLVVDVVLGQLQALLELHQRQRVGRVAVHLVGRAVHERRAVGVAAGRLEQVERPERVDLEVDVRVRCRPVVGRLRGRVDHQLDRVGVLGEHALDGIAIADVDRQRAKRVGVAREQRVGDARGRGVGPEQLRAHVVLEADHLESELDEASDRLRADQPARAGDDRRGHARRADVAAASRPARRRRRRTGAPPRRPAAAAPQRHARRRSAPPLPAAIRCRHRGRSRRFRARARGS